jgi:alkylhydroperoxidase/carboxymuconolactone decarboxylase family protein YurZ
MDKQIPEQVAGVRASYPEVWDAFIKLAEACHDKGGPLDEKSRKLAKLGIAIGYRHEGAVHSAVRQALDAGLTIDELRHVAILAVTTVGWPAARAALTWIDDVPSTGLSESVE